MLTEAVLLQNDGRAETRPDHILKKGYVNMPYCAWEVDTGIVENSNDSSISIDNSAKLSWLYKQYENKSLNTTRIYVTSSQKRK